MSADEKTPAAAVTAAAADAAATEIVLEQERSEKILKAKELCSQGSRNFLVKSYTEAADELSQVCQLYEELYGELSDELGMPYLLYAKSLIALALDENKVIDVPDEEEDNDDDDDDNDEEDDEDAADENAEATNGAAGATSNGQAVKLATIEETKSDTKADEEADSTCDEAKTAQAEIPAEEAQVSSSNAVASETKPIKNGEAKAAAAEEKTAKNAAIIVMDGEKPSTSNGKTNGEEDEDVEEENEAASNLQLAWEILELAAKIFTRQGVSGLANLAEVQTELANIELENNILEAARDDYDKALKIYSELPTNYRRAMAEIHYKIGLTYLMQQLNKEGAESLKAACELIEGEIEEIKGKAELNDKDKNNIQDMEETKQEIWAKIAEIEDTQAQNIAEVRAALDSYIKPISSSSNADGASTSAAAGASGSSSAITSSSPSSAASKPIDISHLIKRKKPEEATSEAEAAASPPAKRPNV